MALKRTDALPNSMQLQYVCLTVKCGMATPLLKGVLFLVVTHEVEAMTNCRWDSPDSCEVDQNGLRESCEIPSDIYARFEVCKGEKLGREERHERKGM